jgi:solute carrier family 25 carnitine/acylcarnitine transporter 20/29
MLLAGSQEASTTDMLIAGGLSGIVAWLLCFPQDVVKSRMQSDPSYKSTLACVRSLLRQNGTNLRAYFPGFAPTMARAFPANAATFVAYEWTIKQMSGSDESSLSTISLPSPSSS